MLPQRRFSKQSPDGRTPPGPGIYFSYARSVAAQKRARVTLREFLRALAVGLVGGTALAVLYGSLGRQYRAIGAFEAVLSITVGTLALRPVLAGLSSANFAKAERNDPPTDSTNGGQT